MRVVIDTNVFIGACLGNGPSCAVVNLCLAEKLQPLMGTALFMEYESLLGRSSLFKKSRLNASEREELLDIFLSGCRWTPIYFGWRPNLPDEGDNHLIELAVAGSAQVIVTRNLRDLERGELAFPDIRNMAPETFLKEYAE